jgi:LmbE family N-acetylglucosaminyl deacetylase
VTFRHSDPGTPASAWAETITELPVLDLGPMRRLIVVAAHPDDETLGAGGLLAMAAAAGTDVEVIVATDGEASHPDSPTHSAALLASIRQDEVTRAIAAVAPGALVHLLHLPDGRLTDHVERLAAAISFQLASPWRDDTWVVSTWLEDGHPDHAAAAAAARDAAFAAGARVLQYPIWVWHWSDPGAGALPLDRAVRLPLREPALASKRAALAEYGSQLGPLSAAPGDECLLPDNLRDFFDQPAEVFVVDQPTESAPAPASLPAGFFDAFYDGRDDPWEFETRWYEARKRALTLASLPRQRFASAFEPGCSIGVWTAELAKRCDQLLAADISMQPLEHAARRLTGVFNVELRQLQIPRDWPTGQFDLIVLSELGYYCGDGDLDLLIQSAVGSLTPRGVLVACHWRHPVQEYPLGGDEVHRRLRAHPDLTLLAQHIEADFLLDVLVPPPGWSVGV